MITWPTQVDPATHALVVSPPDNLHVTHIQLVLIAVTPINQSIAEGMTQQFTATGTFTDGSQANITNTVTWASSAPEFRVDQRHEAWRPGLAVGTTSITATQVDPATQVAMVIPRTFSV